MTPIKKLNRKEVAEDIGEERRKRAEIGQQDINSRGKEIGKFPKKVLDLGLLIGEIDYLFRSGSEKISRKQVEAGLEDEGVSTSNIKMPEELLATEVLGYLAEIGITNIGITEDLDGNDVGLVAIPMKLSGRNIPIGSVLKALTFSIKDSAEYEMVNSKYLELLSKSAEFGNSLEDAIEIVMGGISPENVYQEKINFFIYEEESIKKDEMDTYIVGIAPFYFLGDEKKGEGSIIKQYLEHPNWNEG
ncbi:MAG: hypothetical protein PHP08_00990 [Candidatus Dojkabacteria bacterium]|nr:hypothetical protein [Candidatus Dojkabacteria bacterium]